MSIQQSKTSVQQIKGLDDVEEKFHKQIQDSDKLFS